MYIGKFLLYSKGFKKPLEIPVFFRKPNLTEINNILRKYNFPIMNKKEFKQLYLCSTQYYNYRVYLDDSLNYSIEFIEKYLKY